MIHGLPDATARTRAGTAQLTVLRSHWDVMRVGAGGELETPDGERLKSLESLYRKLDRRLFGRGRWAPAADQGTAEAVARADAGAGQLHLAWRRGALPAGGPDCLCVEYEGLALPELEKAVRLKLGQPGGMVRARVWLLQPARPARLLLEGRLRLDHRSLWRSVVVCAAKLGLLLRAADRRRNRAELAATATATDVLEPVSAARQIWRLARTSLEWKLYREQWQLEVAAAGVDLHRSNGAKTVMRPPDSAFWADPFLLRRGTKTWVLFEELPFATDRGHIASVEVDAAGRAVGKPQIVLQEPWHLSYPFVWHEDGRDYMIPEAGASRELTLYEFVGEDRPWQRVATLISGLRLADATVVRYRERLWMFATCADDDGFMDDCLHVYWADRITGPWHAHALNPVKIDASSSRPAGAMWVAGGVLHRVVQDCSSTYGGRVQCMRIVRLTPEEFEEEPLANWAPAKSESSEPWHTFNTIEDLTVIDRLVKLPRWRSRR